MMICPRTFAPVEHLGRHVLLDIFGARHLGDEAFVEQACKDAAQATGATIIGTNFHHFGGDGGVSVVILLAESHLSIHTWPEFGAATLDIYTCGDCDPEAAIPVLCRRFEAASHKSTVIMRGAPDEGSASS